MLEYRDGHVTIDSQTEADLPQLTVRNSDGTREVDTALPPSENQAFPQNGALVANVTEDDFDLMTDGEGPELEDATEFVSAEIRALSQPIELNVMFKTEWRKPKKKSKSEKIEESTGKSYSWADVYESWRIRQQVGRGVLGGCGQ